MFHRQLSLARLLFGLIAFCNSGGARANEVNSPVEFGKTVSGTLRGAGADIYTFKTKKGGSVIITVSETGQHDDNFFLQLEITGPGNTSMGGGKPGLYRQVMNNVEEGDWSVKVSDGGTVAGGYNFTVLRIPGTEGQKVKFGQEYKGAIKGGSLDVYRISGTPGVNAEIDINSSSSEFMYAFYVFDPAGTNISGGGCSGQCGSGLQLTAYGDYIFMIGADDSGGPTEGSYTLSVKREGESAPAQPAAQASAQPPQAPVPPPPPPQAMTVEQVFQNPVIEIYTDKVLPVSDYPLLYKDGMILTFNEDYLVRDADRHAADAGSAAAQLHTGDNYFKTSPKQAVDDFWTKAANDGNADARNRLGLVYARYHPDQAEKYKTAGWYSRAVAQGGVDAPVKIASLYHGTERPQDDAAIVKLATGYAEKGVPEAQYVLGVAYETGQGVKQDYATAESWYRKAAEKGNPKAEYALGKLYDDVHGSLHREGHGKNQVEFEQHEEAVKWYKLASDHGHAVAQFQQALMYLSGYGESYDFAKTRALFQSAADQGLAAAQFNLAVMYAHGIGGETDYAQAGAWYAKAAAQGLMLAQNDLAELIEHGVGFAQDFATAAKWYVLAADAGYPVAQYNLARLYRDGHGVVKDLTQAKALFAKAAKAGHIEAQVAFNELTPGKPKTHDTIKLLRTAADQSDNAALQKLVEIYRADGIKNENYDDVLAFYRVAAMRLNPVAFVGLADLFAKKNPPDYSESYFWYRLASASTGKWQAYPDEKTALAKYADAEAGKIAGKLMPEQIAVAQWRIADRSPPAPDKQQLSGAEFYIKGDLAEKAGQYITAQQYYIAADSNEVAAAAYDLGTFYEIGRGLARDMKRSVYYFKKAVRNGRVGAATRIGDIYLYGIGVPADKEEAIKWYQMDADRGYERAIDTLGWIYLSGEKKAQVRAIAMYEKASARKLHFNDGPNQALGMIHLYGMGVPKNEKKALNWYLKEPQSGSVTVAAQASWILINFEPHDYVRALKLLGHINDPVLYNDLGYMYERGIGIAELKLDYERNLRPTQRQQPFPKLPAAIELYKRAADMCYGRAMYHIGRLYQSGVNDPAISAEPIPTDPGMARKWMEMAARYGSSAAVDWLKGKDKNNPNPRAAIEPELTLPVKGCRQSGGGQ